MALFYKPRVKETTSSTGTGSMQLLGAPANYQTFQNAFGNFNASLGNFCYYAIYSATQFEYGLGLVTADGNLSRTLVIGGSSGDVTAVNFTAGTKTVICAPPPEACQTNQAELFTNSDTSPDVRLSRVFRAANSGATTITKFDGAIDGQQIAILFENSNTTLQHGTFLKLAGGVNFTGTANDTMTLLYYNGAFYEKSRSVNA